MTMKTLKTFIGNWDGLYAYNTVFVLNCWDYAKTGSILWLPTQMSQPAWESSDCALPQLQGEAAYCSSQFMKWRVQWSNKRACSIFQASLWIFKLKVFSSVFRKKKKKTHTRGGSPCHFSAVFNPILGQTFKDLAVLFLSVETLGSIHP